MPNHDNLYEVKITVGHKLNGDPIRKSFYSPSSKDEAQEQAKAMADRKGGAERTGATFIEKDITFTEWARKWLGTYKPNVDINTYRMTYEQNVKIHLIPYFGKANIKNIRPVDV